MLQDRRRNIMWVQSCSECRKSQLCVRTHLFLTEDIYCFKRYSFNIVPPSAQTETGNIDSCLLRLDFLGQDQFKVTKCQTISRSNCQFLLFYLLLTAFDPHGMPLTERIVSCYFFGNKGMFFSLMRYSFHQFTLVCLNL